MENRWTVQVNIASESVDLERNKMDIYAIREELKSRQKNIFDLKLNVAYYARVSTDKEEQKTLY